MKNNLREIRQSRNLTCKKVAQALDVTEMTVSRYERDEERLRLPTLRRLAEILECSIAQIVGEEPWSSAKEVKHPYQDTVEVIMCIDGILSEYGTVLDSAERERLYLRVLGDVGSQESDNQSERRDNIARSVMGWALQEKGHRPI
ncbi:helix-turn-helix transcriptional regulator [Caenispirillum salinarum]|uniref:helix-turn-helix transcriptional regulator n=1 Tax=Caenispirillum salinarum TaxID=859058 RepID=UPI00384AC351